MWFVCEFLLGRGELRIRAKIVVATASCSFQTERCPEENRNGALKIWRAETISLAGGKAKLAMNNHLSAFPGGDPENLAAGR